jgi:protoporphyrin/coproporphyrin ferrochelatase
MTTGVVVMAYGTPAGPGDVEAYYTHVRRGRPPTAEQLADLQRRYDAIGGISPLLERTRAQIAGIQAALPDGYRVELGQKHAAPFIEDAVAALAESDELVGLVLAPHYSRLSIGEYEERLTAAADDKPVHMIESWHLEPALIELLAEGWAETRARFDGDAAVTTLFTAHSLPSRILDEGDPYPDQLRETAEAVAKRAAVDDWRTAWQSAGRTPEPWLGPDILEVVGGLGGDGVIVCPAGFTSDHLEVLYDVDIEARRVAQERGLQLERTPSLNDDPRLCAALADLVVAQCT